MLTITQRTEAMTAHLLKRITENPNRRDNLHANRTQAIANRDWQGLNETTKRIAKLETTKATNGLKPLFGNCADCRTRPNFKTRQKAIASRNAGEWLQCCAAHVPGNKLPQPRPVSRFHEVEAL